MSTSAFVPTAGRVQPVSAASPARGASARTARLSSKVAVPPAFKGTRTFAGVGRRSKHVLATVAPDSSEAAKPKPPAPVVSKAKVKSVAASVAKANGSSKDGASKDGAVTDSFLSSDSEDITEEARVAIPFTLPLEQLEGLYSDVSECTTDELVESDGVYNHEASWISFNWRVLAMAMDKTTPLLERLRFIAIVHRNLDEFFAKRVGALKRQEAAGIANLKNRSTAGSKGVYTPTQFLDYMAKAVNKQVDAVEECLLDDVLPKLKERGLFLLNYDECTLDEKATFDRWFLEEIEPLLTPLAVDPGHPFPYLSSLAINLAVMLHDPEMPGDSRQFAIVTVPSMLSRWRPIEGRPNSYVPLEQIVSANLDHLFGGMDIISVSPFRATRNADVERNEEEAEDLLEMMTDEVRERKFAPFVRLEVADGTPDDVRGILCSQMLMQRGKWGTMSLPLSLPPAPRCMNI
mmetsp:Transcript_16970/g.53905  ORF Transcript_16970/g.53905 Transcript_16970/m.53905 type:complete len:462 (-) Transcript_16970:359-1744(-)